MCLVQSDAWTLPHGSGQGKGAWLLLIAPVDNSGCIALTDGIQGMLVLTPAISDPPFA